MDEERRRHLARALADAGATGQPVARLADEGEAMTNEDAYRIQEINIARRLDEGRSVIGYKVGLTSKAMQEMFGVNQPDFGHLLDDMAYPSGAAIDVSGLISPKVEIETAFILGADLKGPGLTADAVLEATDRVVPAIELIDSRIADWKIALVDTIADNASSAGIITGTDTEWTPALDLATSEATLSLNGEAVATGCGADVLGHPAIAVAWLANTLAPFDIVLRAGQVILPGACAKAFDVTAGDRVVATFAGVGSVRASFVGAT